jgi:hypothetical protein
MRFIAGLDNVIVILLQALKVFLEMYELTIL